MSLRIEIDHVTEVLLADGWHKVLDRSFDIDAYEFESNERVICSPGEFGYRFDTEIAGRRCRLSGPLSAVLAVNHWAP